MASVNILHSLTVQAHLIMIRVVAHPSRVRNISSANEVDFVQAQLKEQSAESALASASTGTKLQRDVHALRFLRLVLLPARVLTSQECNLTGRSFLEKTHTVNDLDAMHQESSKMQFYCRGTQIGRDLFILTTYRPRGQAVGDGKL